MSASIHSKIAAAAVALAVVAQPAAALAKSICVFDPANSYAFVFSKVKLPKKPGETTSATVERINTIVPGARPCSGPISKLTNGSVKIGLTCYGGDGGSGFMVGWTSADVETLVGTAGYETDGDFDFNEISVGLTTVDCETLTLP